MENNRPTVLIATGIMNAGGTETLIMEMLRHQTGRVHYILMIHYQGEIQKGMFDDEIRSLGVPIVYIPSVGMLGVKDYNRKFKEVVNSLGRIDVIHSHLNASGGIICMAAKKAGIRYRITHCHADICFNGSTLDKVKNELSLQVLRLYVNYFSNHFWACSHTAWRRLFYPWKNEVIIPNMIDAEKYLSLQGEKENVKEEIGLAGKYVVGSIGRVAPIKNYEIAIEAVSVLNKRGQETHFVCYGRFDAEKDTYCAKLIDLAKKLDVRDKVHFMGNTTKVAHVIKAFDVFVMPSTTEGFGMAAIEAQAAAIPTLLSEGVPRIVDIEAGLVKFLSINSPKTWADAVVNMKDCERPDNDVILGCLDKKGYNSVTMVKEIEKKYIALCQ